ncbi:MAG: fibrobacter succinogenes major paralogous domain-containing protein [Chitinispirillales bacterium]|jgi:uncharacterized protein (TIGR02145 family)|nr:fibrobacter succinogenes major paralogous domain-containing protein [Chitinispirillales bacterium]
MTVFKKIVQIKPYKAFFLAALLFCVCSDSSVDPNQLYTLTVNAGTGGTAAGGGSFSSGTNAAISAAASSGCAFSGWTPTAGVANPNSSNTTVSMTTNRTVTANFNCEGGGEEGSFTDSRDGQVYRTVTIGSQTWMGENLNFNAQGSVCYDDDPGNCDIYGRLYDWNTVMAGSPSSSTSPSGVQGICPVGWHVPSEAEWTTLVNFVGGREVAGAKLRSRSGWHTGSGHVPGTDDFGFSALPGGYRWSGSGGFLTVGDDGRWWSATENDATSARIRAMYWDDSNVGSGGGSKTILYSLRCLRD